MSSSSKQSAAKAKKTGKGVLAAALKKKTRTKVIEVSLSTKKTPAKAGGQPAPKTRAKTAQSPARAKGFSKTASRPARSQNKAQKNTRAEQTKPQPPKAAAQPLQAAAAVSETANEMFVQPNLNVLKHFRRAAKETRKQLREKARELSKRSGFLAKAPKKGKRYAIDLRVHSPGTEGYLAPSGVDAAIAIVRLARVKGLTLLGLTDQYNASHVDQVKALAQNTSLTVLPGLDLCCRIGHCEEAQITALFPETHTSADLFQVLELLRVPPSAYGKTGYCIRLPFADVVDIVEQNGGVIIPSRVDRTPYSQLAIPTLVNEFGFHVFDLAYPDNPEYFRERWPQGGFSFFSFSGANSLGQIGNRASKLRLENPGFAAIRELVKRRAGSSAQ